jgi:hypothetical protein
MSRFENNTTRILATVLALALTIPCPGKTIVVGPPQEPIDSSLSDAILAAEDGDTVLVGPGAYRISAPLDFNALHDPDDPASPPVKDITVRSSHGPSRTTIAMQYEPPDLDHPPVPPCMSSVLIFQSGETRASRLEGFNITEGMGINRFGEWNISTQGGGISCIDSSPTIANCVIAGNGSVPDAVEHVGNGGGMFCMGGAPLLVNCAILGNVADEGGGLYANGSSPILINCLIAGNMAVGPCCTMTACSPCGKGAGMFMTSAGGNAVQLINCTITENLGGSWAVTVWNEDPVISISSSIIWGNKTFDDDEQEDLVVQIGNPGSVTRSLVGGPGVWPGEGNIDGDPLFETPGTWQDMEPSPNWDPDPSRWKWIAGDYRLRPGSPCIDAGTGDGAPETDLDGKGRPCGVAVDMGAYELGPCSRFLRGDANGDGSHDLADPIRVLESLFLGGGPLPCLDAGDADDTGAIEITDAVYSLEYLFLGGPRPPEPLLACSIDPTADGLDCASFSACGPAGE